MQDNHDDLELDSQTDSSGDLFDGDIAREAWEWATSHDDLASAYLLD